MSWEPLTYTQKIELQNALSDLVTVTARDPAGELKIMGTAFPVLATSSVVVLMTALHVLEYAFNQSGAARSGASGRLSHLPGPDNTLFNHIENWVRDSREVVCLFAKEDRLIECVGIAVCLRPPLDIALLIVDSTPMGGVVPVFAINSDLLMVGDKVVMTAYSTNGNTRDLVARQGEITAVDQTGPLVKAPVYSTNIPIEAGASGGPIFQYTGKFYGHKEVVGVVSSDFSKKYAFDNPAIDGESRVSMIWSAAPLQLEDMATGKIFTFKDLCEEKRIVDVGSTMNQVELIYNEDLTWHQRVPLPEN